MTYANGNTVDYGYSNGDAVTGVTYSNGEDVQGEYIYDYDAYGTLKSITNQADITKTYSQNNAARTYTETVTGANYLYENIAHYDSNGYYTGSNYTFTHGTLASQDAEREIGVEYKSYLQGLIGSTTDGDFTSSYSYNAENFISEITQTLGEESVSTAYEYDENNRLTKVTVNDTIYRLTYDYMGNITRVTKNGAEYLTYSYDDAGRLISENNTNFSCSYTYTYDGNNNIATVAETSKPTQDSPELPLLPARTTTNTYVYEGDKLLGKRGAGSMSNLISYTSDANGNLTNYGGRELTWNQGGKLNTVEERADRPSITGAMQYNTYRYSYDENGLRYKKVNTVNGITTETRYFLDGSTIIAEEAGGNLTQYYYDSTGVIGMRYNNVNYYFVKDLFGNVHQVLHQDGTRVAEYEYDAWGNCEITFDRWDIYDQSKSKIADKNPFRYRGYYMDVETGYYYLQSRYYDPALRRFISSDSYDLISTLAESGDINLFAYCGNNPVMCVDETGCFPILTFITSLFVGALTGFLVEYVQDVVVNTEDGFQFSDLNTFTSENIKKYFISSLKGAVTGAAFGVGAGLGISAFNAGVRIATSTALIALGATTVGSFAAGMGIYALETKVFELGVYDTRDLWKAGAKMGVKGALNFGFGLLLGNQGFYNESLSQRIFVKQSLMIPLNLIIEASFA